MFSVPLNFGATSRTRDGYGMEHIAAELNYDRKVFEQDQTWKDLMRSLGEAKQRLDLSQKLEMIQKNKLLNEQSRLKQGRSTTYQVLLFEQDYLQAELLRIQNQFAILKIISQMKLFGENV
jgi:outer membrane protein TolC